MAHITYLWSHRLREWITKRFKVYQRHKREICNFDFFSQIFFLHRYSVNLFSNASHDITYHFITTLDMKLDSNSSVVYDFIS